KLVLLFSWRRCGRWERQIDNLGVSKLRHHASFRGAGNRPNSPRGDASATRPPVNPPFPPGFGKTPKIGRPSNSETSSTDRIRRSTNSSNNTEPSASIKPNTNEAAILSSTFGDVGRSGGTASA